MRITLFGGESTELAGQDADVGIINVTIVNVGCIVAVLPLAHHVGNHSKSVKIVRTIETERIRLRDPLLRLNLFSNRSEFFRDKLVMHAQAEGHALGSQACTGRL